MPITEEDLKRPANPRSQGYTIEEMEAYEEAVKREAEQLPAEDRGYSIEEVENMDRAKQGLEGLQQKREYVGSILEPIGTAITAPAREVQRSLQTAADLLTGQPGKAWERAKTGAPATPLREVLPNIGVSSREFIPTGLKDIEYKDIKTSPANIGAFALEAAIDPLNWPGGPQGALATAGAVGKGVGTAWHGTTKKLASGLANIGEPDFDYLIANRERLKGKTYSGPEQLSEVAATVETQTQKYKDRAEYYKNKADTALADAKYQWNTLKRDLNEPAKTLEEQNLILSQMQKVKDDLTSLSIEADEALANSGKTYRRGDIIELLRKVASEGLDRDIVTPAAQKTVDTITDIIERLGGSVQQPAGFARKQQQRIADEVLDAPRVRDILKQVRDTIDFSKASGEFDDSLNRVLKNFQYGVSKVLKDDVPEYKALMSSMSEMADVLGDMRGFVGGANQTQEQLRATNLVNTLRKGGAKAESLTNLLERFANISKNNDLLEAVERLKERSGRKQTMQGMTFEHDYGAVFPDESEKLKELLEAKKRAEERVNAVSRPYTDTAALIKHLSTQNLNQDKAIKQAARIKDYTGIDLRREAGDIGVVNRITSAKPAGAKWVGLGTAAGTAAGMALTKDAAGATVGGLLGGLGGGAWERYGGRGAKWLVDRGTGIRQITDKITRLPKKYAGPLLKVASEQGPQITNVYHHLMYNNDPEYRAIVDSLLEE